ncbi:hypothetical protein HYV82_06745 [Candidatus Woesearchaeota archaeon]|nr:hypothetical protein [Candidatus Woesearchaeota archaeon]
MNLVEAVGRFFYHMDPLNDMECMGQCLEAVIQRDNPPKIYQEIIALAVALKPLMRGGSVGAVVGALAAPAGQSPFYIATGALVGAFIDAAQYFSRVRSLYESRLRF